MQELTELIGEQERRTEQISRKEKNISSLPVSLESLGM